MKLFLTSTGLTNKSLKNKLIELVGKQPEEMSVAYITTAFNTSSNPNKRWVIDNIKRLDEMKIANIDILDFSAIPKEMWLPRIERADVIYVEGGSPIHLATEMERTGFKDVLKKLNDKVYVGCSAGSNILGEVMIKSSKEAPGFTMDKGFGWIKLSIRPHYLREDRIQFDDELIDSLAKQYKSDFYAIDDDSGIVVNGDKVEIISEGKWKKFEK